MLVRLFLKFDHSLLEVFRERVDVSGPTVAWLAENAYAAYVFHAPVLVATSYAVRNV